jgi:hypothetical protein
MTCELRVKRDELFESLKKLAKNVKGNTRREARFSFVHSHLRIDLDWESAEAYAEGSWSGIAAVVGRDLVRLGRAIPKDAIRSFPLDSIRVAVSGDHFHIGNDSLLLLWYDEKGDKIHLPLNPELSEVLALRLKHSDSEILYSGLNYILLSSEQRRDAIVAQATKLLKLFGVQQEDVHNLVKQAIKRKHGL